jgi:aminocarboxymuconate-semialdehyde decarboxylase
MPLRFYNLLNLWLRKRWVFMKCFDAHCHLLPQAIYKDASFYNESWGDAAGHIKAMDEAGVARAVISYPTTDYHVRKGVPEITAAMDYNRAVKVMTAIAGGRLVYLAAIPLTEPGEMIVEMTRAVLEGAVGLTMPTNSGGAYPDEERFFPFFCEVERMGLPVFFHPTTVSPFGHDTLQHPLITPVFQYAFDTTLCLARVVGSGLLAKLPGLKLVFASFGGAMPFFAGRFDRTYRMLVSRGIISYLDEDPGTTLKKIYADTSGTDSPALLNLALEVFGDDRLLWGSDYPANRNIASSIEAVKSLGISNRAKEKVLCGNMEKLFM